MKRTIQGLLLAGSLVIGGTALAQGTQGATQGTGTPGTTQGSAQGQTMKGTTAKAGKPMVKGGMVEHMGFMVPADEKAYLERLHHMNQLEIQLGKLAQQNAASPEVKTFANQMVQDHTAADEKLMTYAQGKNLKLGTPKPMNEVERKSMAAEKAYTEKLEVLKGAPFDSAYMANQVGSHDHTLGKLMAGQQAFSANAEVTAMINDLSRHVAQHRQSAHSVLGKLSPSAMGVGGAGDVNKDMHQGHGTGGAGDMHKGQGSGTGGAGDQKKY